jgi:hypothetical protein
MHGIQLGWGWPAGALAENRPYAPPRLRHIAWGTHSIFGTVFYTKVFFFFLCSFFWTWYLKTLVSDCL